MDRILISDLRARCLIGVDAEERREKQEVVINLALSFAIAGISIGGHIGGLIGGVLATLAFARWGRGHAAYGRLGLGGALGLVLLAGASVAISYWKVRGLA